MKHSKATFILLGEQLYRVDHFLELDAHLTARLFFCYIANVAKKILDGKLQQHLGIWWSRSAEIQVTGTAV